MVKYPNITIELVGQDGNAFSILARCIKALERNGLHNEADTFVNEATAGDYGHLLRTVVAWFSLHDEDKSEDEERSEWYEQHPYGCYDCQELYAQGGCPSCGE